MTAAEISRDKDLKQEDVSRWTISRFLQEEGLNAKKMQVGFIISEINKEKRIIFAK